MEIALLASALIIISLQLWLPFEPAIVDSLSILVFIAVLWLTEALDVSITPLLVPMIAVVLGVLYTTKALRLLEKSRIKRRQIKVRRI